MTDCTRFENEGLLLIESGVELDEHFYTCKTCIEEQRKYDALKGLISSSDAGLQPALDWQKKVLDSVRESRSNQYRNWYGSIAASVVIIAVTAFMIPQFAGVPTSNHSIELELVSNGQVYRGEDVKIGDTLNVNASPENSAYVELRVYRDGRLHFSCGVQSPCNTDAGALKTRIELSSMGEYQIALIKADEEILLLKNHLDADVLSARDRGAEVFLSKSIYVR